MATVISLVQMQAIENKIEKRMERMKTAERNWYVTTQKTAMDTAMKNFRKNPSALNWNTLELNMFYFQQTTFTLSRINRGTLIDDCERYDKEMEAKRKS